ncbi:helix-turn-helix domain-containing protein [Streptomyces sp. NPDC059816]|uniref:helix-turn-helix domain-containing protein n=1 Tax=Streptomyces sp. NPDC059816 TaxID=3346960 RepID=UPI0036496D74
MPKKRDSAPADFLASGHQWPSGQLVADAPPTARLGKELAVRLKQALQEQGLSARQVADAAQLRHPTVLRVLNGTVVPDGRTIIHLETALKTPLWPAGLHEHLTLPPAESGAAPS